MYDQNTLDNGTPPPFNYYKYMGSFTTPPCAENIVWFVASKPLKISTTFVDMLRESVKENFSKLK